MMITIDIAVGSKKGGEHYCHCFLKFNQNYDIRLNSGENDVFIIEHFFRFRLTLNVPQICIYVHFSEFQCAKPGRFN